MMKQTTADNNTVTTPRRTPIYPSVTLTGCRPTVNGVSYDTWAEALAAKFAAVTYRTVDIYGREEATQATPLKVAA